MQATARMASVVSSTLPARRRLIRGVRHFMSTSLQQAVQKAIATLPKRHAFKTGSDEFELRTLFPVESWRPHTEPCRRAGSLAIGEDSCGNFFLSAPDGSVSFWDHETDGETVLASSVEAFLAGLVEPTPVVLQPGQVKKAWIDPAFFAEQRRNGNA
jgi:hypothetical protein